jgi:hypothetical protein
MFPIDTGAAFAGICLRTFASGYLAASHLLAGMCVHVIAHA